MASPVRRGGPFAPPRTSVARKSECNIDLVDDKTGQPGTTHTRGYGSSSRVSTTGAGGSPPLAASPLSRPLPQPPASPKPGGSPFAQAPQQPSYPPSRQYPPRLSQQLPSPIPRASRSKIVPENSGTLEYAGSGQLSRLQLPPGSPLVGTPTGSRCGSRNWDALPGIEAQQPQQQLSAPLLLMAPQPLLASPSLTGGQRLATRSESQSISGYSPTTTPAPPPAPTTPAGIVMVKNNVTLVVHHYVKEPDSDDTDIEEERGSNNSSNCSSDSETNLPAAPPRPSAFLHCMAVICCMAPAKPQRRSRRRSRRPSTLMSATEAQMAGHVIGPQATAVDFVRKWAVAQAVTPIPALKRSNSANNIMPLAQTPLEHTPLAISRAGTVGGMAAERPDTGYSAGYSAGSRFSSYSIPPEGSSPLPRSNSLRSPADVRLSDLGAPVAYGGGGPAPTSATDAVGWSFMGAPGAGGGGGGGTGVAGGSPPSGGGLRVAGDSLALSTISSFSGHLSSGRPSATQAPVLIASGLVQCFQQQLEQRAAAGAVAPAQGGVATAAQQQHQQQQRQQPRRTGTSSTTGAGSSSCRTTSYKRTVRWH